MSESETAAGKIVEGDCPLCLEPLPPFWDWERRTPLTCCGNFICNDCRDTKNAHLCNARTTGSFGRQEEQLNNYCPLCRTLKPMANMAGKTMMGKFQKDQLPLNLYCDLGVCFVYGDKGVERDVQRGMELWKLGAEKGDPNCQFQIGTKSAEAGSLTDAKRWFLAATERGHAIAEYNLALMLADEGNCADYLRHISGSVSKGLDNACFDLGKVHFFGEHGLTQSTEEAIRILTPAAERGHAKSMGLLGCILCQPDPQLPPPSPMENPNFTKGVHWIRRAAEKGDQTSTLQIKHTEEMASRMCFMCDKDAPPDKTFLRCSRCRAAWYCSKDCQIQHWKAAEAGHKQRCIKWDEKWSVGEEK